MILIRSAGSKHFCLLIESLKIQDFWFSQQAGGDDIHTSDCKCWQRTCERAENLHVLIFNSEN